MKKFTRAIAVTAVAMLPIVGLSAAPAQAKTTSPQQWSTKFCTALGDWLNTIQGSSSNVSGALANTTDLAGAKTTLVDFLSGAIDATDTAISDIKSAGAPDTPNGSKIQAAILAGFGKAKAIFVKAESDSEGLSTTDAAAFTSAATDIGTQIQNSSSQIDTAFSKVDKLDKSGKLQGVVKKTRACKFLNTSA